MFLIETSVPACKDIVEEQWLLAMSVRLNKADKNHSRQGEKKRGGVGVGWQLLLAATVPVFPLSTSQPEL